MTEVKQTVLSVDTNALVGMLTDILRSACKDVSLPMLNGVMLHVDTHDNGPILVATASDRYTLGQAYIKAGGGMRSLWMSADNLAQILPLLRPFARRRDTMCDVTVSGRKVTFSQNPLPGMATVSVTVETESNDNFPDISRFVSDAEPSLEVPTFVAQKLNVPLQVAVRRNESVRIHSYGALKPAWVYVGNQYRCLVMPMRASDSTECPWFNVPDAKKLKRTVAA